MIFLTRAFEVISLLSAKKVHCGSGEMVYITRWYHPNVDNIAALAIRVLLVILCMLVQTFQVLASMLYDPCFQ